jgi:hypothetical protein
MRGVLTLFLFGEFARRRRHLQSSLADLFAKLSAGGQVMMPLDNYGFSRRFG